MRILLRCKTCGRAACWMDAPTSRELRQLLKHTPFAAAAAFIPSQAASELATLPIYECTACTPVEDSSDASEEEAQYHEASHDQASASNQDGAVAAGITASNTRRRR